VAGDSIDDGKVENRSLVLRQRLKGAADEQLLEEVATGRGLVSVGLVERHRCVGLGGPFFAHPCREVEHDSEEPGLAVGALIKAIKETPRPKKRFLNEIFGDGGIAGDADSSSKQAGR